jgi:hypothetical protein
MSDEYIGLFWSCNSNIESCKCSILDPGFLCLPQSYDFHLVLELRILLVYFFNHANLAVQINIVYTYIKRQDCILSNLLFCSISKGLQELGIVFLFFFLLLVFEDEDYASA